MVGFKRKKKSSKMRGSREHGRGKKKGRGAGLRGGRGNAGAHKHKRVLYFSKLTDGSYWGKRGFKRPLKIVSSTKTLNVQELEEILPSLVEQGKAQKSPEGYEVDLTPLGFTKLLGGGRISTPIRVRIPSSSSLAKEKIQRAGGEILEGPPSTE